MEDLKEYILPILLSQSTLREIHAQHFLPFLLAPKEDNSKSILSKSDYHTLIIPFIIRQFDERERNIRIAILKQLPVYVSHLPPPSLRTIFPKMLDGLFDKEPNLVMTTIDAFQSLVFHLKGSKEEGLNCFCSFHFFLLTTSVTEKIL